MDELRKATRRLAALEGGMGHGGHRGEHAPASCQYCREWTLAVLAVWKEADRQFGPESVALGVIRVLEMEDLPRV